MKYGLVLEGGGAKGAYQVGVVKALFEAEYEFDVMVGTSIGAINSAYLAQGEFKKLYKLWKTLSFSDLFDLENEKLEKAMKKNLDMDTVKYMSSKLGNIIKEKGLATTKMRQIMEDTIDEKKLRKSDVRFGLVTMCITDMKPQELFIEDIPKGKLIDYLIATSNLPVFQRARIDDKQFIDGGAWDPCPIEMLEGEGYTDIITVRVYKKLSRIRNYDDIIKRNNAKIYMIAPQDTLPSILNFDTKNLNELLKLGYYDGLRFTKKLKGYRYYFKSVSNEKINSRIKNISFDYKLKLTKDVNVSYNIGENIDKVFYDKTLKELVSKTKVKEAYNLDDMVIAIFEEVALNEGINRYKLYDFSEFVRLVKEKAEKSLKESKKNKALYDFVLHF